MSSCRSVFGAALLLAAGAVAAGPFEGIGRAATPGEIAAWDIDVRPDFKGLPPGAGSVAAGMQVWESKCASCHGVFGESNEVFSPIVGGTSRQDLVSGRVARLTDSAFPQRTTLMKLPSVSTLWDYIRRAMPWTQPKSLSIEEVYAVTAYILHLGDVVPGDFVLSDRNIAEVQARLPNRHGMTTDHAMWPGRSLGGHRAPDVRGSRCMSDCGPLPRIASSIPDHARDAHGDLAQQQRLVGGLRGVRTAPATAAHDAAVPADTAVAMLLQQHACTACHGLDRRMVGPSFREIAARHAARADAQAYLAGKIRDGGQGVWGSVPMPSQVVSEADAGKMAQWLVAGAPR